MIASKGRPLRLRWRGLAYLTLLAIAVVAVNYSLTLLRAASVLYSFSIKEAPLPVRLYNGQFGDLSDVTELSFPGSSGTINVRVYTPIGRNAPPTIVMVHGFAPNGNRDAGLNLFASRLARVGFRVVLPTVPAEQQFEMRSSDLVVIGDAIRWSAQTYAQRVSVVGISFGGGLVIPAAAQPSVAGDVKLIFCLSGYNNLDSIGHYYLHDRVNDPSGKAYLGQGPSTGPLLVVSQYLDEMVPPEDVAALRSPLDRFRRLLGAGLPAGGPTLAALTPPQEKIFEQLQTVTSNEMRQRYLDVLVHHQAEIASLSPSSVLGHLQIPLYVLHGSSDQTIPAGEIEWMKKETSGNQDTHILITPWMAHASVGQPVSLLEKLRVGIFFAHLLAEASHHSR